MKKLKEGNNHQDLGNRNHNFPKVELPMFLKLEIIDLQNYICEWGRGQKLMTFIINTFSW